MIHRRDVLAAAVTLALSRHATGQPRGRIHALLVGINTYRVNPLRGCLNDARLIEQSLGALGAEVSLLLDAQATRAAFMRRWHEVASRTVPGDTFIFHFAGHGALDPRIREGGRPDTTGDFLLFRDYHTRDAPDELLLDTELHRLLIEVHRRGVQPVVLLDCCYADALTRSIDPRAADGDRYRTPGLNMADVAAAMARLPPPPPSAPPAALEPILFIAAGQASEAVPEIRAQDGQPHGALSIGFARAITGAADTNRDGVLTRGELFNHILVAARTLAESRQHPVMQPPGRLDEPILAVPRPGATARAPGAASVPGPDDKIHLSILNLPRREADAIIRAIPGAILAGSETYWDLRWDAQTQEAFGPGRDLLASRTPQAALPAIVQRIGAQRRLGALALASALNIQLVWRAATSSAESDASHPAGRRLELRASNLRLPYLIVFNLTGDGTVQQLHPNPRAPVQQRIDDPGIGPPPIGFCVRSPFGSDLAVALATDRPRPALIATLVRLDGQQAVADAMIAVEAALAGVDWQIGVQTVVTRPNEGEERECR